MRVSEWTKATTPDLECPRCHETRLLEPEQNGTISCHVCAHNAPASLFTSSWQYRASLRQLDDDKEVKP